MEDASSTSKRTARQRRSDTGSRRVTLKDVAAAAGVSATAASFVLNGRDDQRISTDTQQKVQAAATALGYRPDQTARILRTGTSGTIAFVSDFISTTGYASGVLRGALEVARQHGTLLYIAETLGDVEVERKLLQSMLDRRVDGFVYASMFTHEVRVPETLLDVPFVLLNCQSKGARVTSIVPDELGAGVTAAQALLAVGHRDGIWFVGDLTADHEGVARWGQAGRTPLALRARLRGIRAELKRHQTKLAGTLVVTDWEPEEGRRVVSEALGRGDVVRALICVNDRVAMGAYQALEAEGLHVPQDVSVVSFDDSPLAGWLQPPLTSVALPHEELGRLAVTSLLSGKRDHTGRTLISMPLSDRGSVGPPL